MNIAPFHSPGQIAYAVINMTHGPWTIRSWTGKDAFSCAKIEASRLAEAKCRVELIEFRVLAVSAELPPPPPPVAGLTTPLTSVLM